MNADFSFYPRSSAFVRVQSNEFGFGLSELGFMRQCSNVTETAYSQPQISQISRIKN
jgi:hypothetical protein